MLFKSTRSTQKATESAAQVIKQGLANDGGLFVPESIPSLTQDEIKVLCGDSYPVRAAKILSKFLSDYTYEELLEDCEKASKAVLQAGEYGIFFPWDAHKPGLCYGGNPDTVRKIVVKVRAD